MERIIYHVGGLITVRGLSCRIIKHHGCGTIDVETLDGARCFRVTGLPIFDLGGRS